MKKLATLIAAAVVLSACCKAPVTAMPPASPVPPESYMVFFDFDKSNVTPEAAGIIAAAAENAKTAGNTVISVTGHTDTVGSQTYNMKLSLRRADAVKAELERNGIPSSQVAVYGKGKADLLVPTGDGVREPQNRRAVIILE